MSAQTQLTPRNIEGNVNPQVARSRVLPYEANPRYGWKPSLHGISDSRIGEALNKESLINKSVLRDHSGFKNKALNHYIDIDDMDSPYPESLDHFPSSVVPKLTIEEVRVKDKHSVLLDGKEVLETLGVPNKRQTHDLCLSSAYAGYGVGGEPLFTASMPSEKNKVGTECLDYIFFSSGTLQLERLLSMPLLSEIRRGERPQASGAKEDVPYTKPFYISEGSFNTPILKLNQTIGVSNPNSEVDLLSGGVGIIAGKVSRSAVEEAKRVLRSAMEKSRIAGNTPVTSTVLSGTTHNINVNNGRGGRPCGDDNDEDAHQQGGGSSGVVVHKKTSASGLWGGKWAAFPVQNHQRMNFWLPGETFVSSHLAIGAEFSIDHSLLCTYWS